mmetsp:Transcript_30931/g.67881  ORF Transcript_30931/g.67881 Transcript_30931/m.67881 type:complete len:263 (+) Transcript_30931:709-1497(+)
MGQGSGQQHLQALVEVPVGLPGQVVHVGLKSALPRGGDHHLGREPLVPRRLVGPPPHVLGLQRRRPVGRRLHDRPPLRRGLPSQAVQGRVDNIPDDVPGVGVEIHPLLALEHVDLRVQGREQVGRAEVVHPGDALRVGVPHEFLPQLLEDHRFHPVFFHELAGVLTVDLHSQADLPVREVLLGLGLHLGRDILRHTRPLPHHGGADFTAPTEALRRTRHSEQQPHVVVPFGYESQTLEFEPRERGLGDLGHVHRIPFVDHLP